jgi:hypothetical protein
VVAQRPDAFVASRDHPSIQYSTGAAKNPVADLNFKIESGTARLAFEDSGGYLRSTLGALNVPVESQVAVFSQTSNQSKRINPRNPRAIFFNDAVAVGWVRGGTILEVAAQDAQQGVIFYTLDQTQVAKPQFRRDDRCLECHR